MLISYYMFNGVIVYSMCNVRNGVRQGSALSPFLFNIE